MKQFLLLFIFAVIAVSVKSQSVGIGTTTPDASALLDVTSTTKGVLIPRMTKTDRLAIPAPAVGLMVYQNGPDSAGFYHFD